MTRYGYTLMTDQAGPRGDRICPGLEAGETHIRDERPADMHKAVRRPAIVLSLVAVASLLLAGCGNDPGDDEPSIGQVERNRTVTAANLALVTDGEGVGTLVGTLINDDTEIGDRLVDVDAETDSGPVEVDLVRGPVVLPVDEPVRLGDEPTVVITSDDLRQGFRIELELTFARSRSISTTVTVESQTGPYADIEVPAAR